MNEPIGSFDSMNDGPPGAASVASGRSVTVAGIVLGVIAVLVWFLGIGGMLSSLGWSDPGAAPYLAALAAAGAYLGWSVWLLCRRPVQAQRVPLILGVAATAVVLGAAVVGLVLVLSGGKGCTANVEMIKLGRTVGTAPAMLCIPVLFRVRQGAVALLPMAIVLALTLVAASAIPSGLFACYQMDCTPTGCTGF